MEDAITPSCTTMKDAFTMTLDTGGAEPVRKLRGEGKDMRQPFPLQFLIHEEHLKAEI